MGYLDIDGQPTEWTWIDERQADAQHALDFPIDPDEDLAISKAEDAYEAYLDRMGGDR